jgi:predicted nucleic acid-binding protein
MVDFADLLIAATAKAHSLSLATLNLKHFEKIPDLRIVNS